MKYLYCIAFMFLMLSNNVLSQKITNVNYEYADNKIVVNYDLSGPDASAWWISLFISEDEGVTWINLKKVSGDIGDSNKRGTRKKIIWDRTAENITITKKFEFKVVAEPDIYYAASSGTFIDERDGSNYKWVQIGGLIWMAQNLNAGTSIEDIVQSDNGITEKYCYNNEYNNCITYGGLYQWDEMVQYSKSEGNRGICPNHWHLPEITDWENLIYMLGGKNKAYGKIKEIGIQHWKQSTKGTTNEFRLSVLPAGIKSSDTTGFFVGLGNQACFWSSSENDTNSAKAMGLNNQLLEVYFFNGLKTDSYSVRCVRD